MAHCHACSALHSTVLAHAHGTAMVSRSTLFVYFCLFIASRAFLLHFSFHLTFALIADALNIIISWKQFAFNGSKTKDEKMSLFIFPVLFWWMQALSKLHLAFTLVYEWTVGQRTPQTWIKCYSSTLQDAAAHGEVVHVKVSPCPLFSDDWCHASLCSCWRPLI